MSPLLLLLACADPPPPHTDPPDTVCGSAEVADGDTCVPEACGAGPWGGREADVYVDAAAAAGGDGSAEHPFVDLADALVPGAVVALAAGSYPAGLLLDEDAPAALLGRCADLVELTAGDTDPLLVLDATADTEVALSGVALRPAPAAGIEVAKGRLTLADVTIEGAADIALFVHGARGVAAATGLVVRDSAARDDAGGRAFDVEDGGTLTVDGCTLSGNHDVAVAVFGPSEVALTDCVVSDTLANSRAGFGIAAQATDGASLTLTDVTLERFVGLGLLAVDTGTTVSLERVTVAEAAPTAQGEVGRAVDLEGGADTTAVDVVVTGAHEAGVYVSGAGTTLDWTGGSILDTEFDADGRVADPILVRNAGTAVFTGLTIDGSPLVGGYVSDAGTSVSLVDSTVRGVTTETDDGGGAGLLVAEGAGLLLRRTELVDNVDVQLVLLGASATVEDSTFTHAVPDGTGYYGYSAQVTAGASLTLTDTTLSDTSAVGVLVAEPGSWLGMTGGSATGNRAHPEDGGAAFRVQDGGEIVLDGVDVADNGGSGILVSDEGSVGTVRGGFVRGTTEDPHELGVGVIAGNGATVTLDGTRVEDNHSAGVYADVGATLDLTDVTITGTRSDAAGTYGYGLYANHGSTVTARGGTIDGSRSAAVLLLGDGTTARFDGTAITGTRPATDVWVGVGITAGEGATAELVGVTLDDHEGPGIFAYSRGVITATDTTVTRSRWAGAVVENGTLTLDGVTVSDTVAAGAGIDVYAYGLGLPTEVRVRESTLGVAPLAAVWVEGQVRVEVEDSRLDGGPGVSMGGVTVHGNAVYARGVRESWDGEGGLRFAGNDVGASRVGVLLDGATASLEGNAWTDVATEVLQQGCDGTLAPVDTADATVVACPTRDQLVVPLPRFAVTLAEPVTRE